MATESVIGDKDHRVDGSPSFENIVQYVSAVDGIGDNLSDKTIQDYCRKTASLENEVIKAGENVTPENMVSLLVSKSESGRYAQSTIRSMKAALMFWLLEKAQSALSSGVDLSALQQALTRIKTISAKESPRNTGKTSSKKLKFFPESTLKLLVDYANAPNGARNLGALLSFVRANLLVGLRPAEWISANLATYLHRDEHGQFLRNAEGRIISTPALIVKNAKASYGRANGYYRELLLTSISDDDLASIIHFKDMLTKFIANYPADKSDYELADAFFVPLQKTLSNTLKKLQVPQASMPTSYSTRHQAVANAKFSGMSDVEIAAFFGHSSTSTAKSHYGKKMSGWSKMTFRASNESINAVPQKAIKPSMTPSPTTVLTASEWNANTQPR